MAKISSRGEIVETSGELPEVGSAAPDFTLRKADLSPVGLADYAGKRLVLNIFPSIDTPTCATSVRQFNQRAAAMPNTTETNAAARLVGLHASEGAARARGLAWGAAPRRGWRPSGRRR